MEIEVTYEKKINAVRKVEVPSYHRNMGQFYKIISEKECLIVVPNGVLGPEVTFRPIDFAIEFGTHSSSAEEFDTALSETLAKITTAWKS